MSSGPETVDDIDYELPESAIAQTPVEPRDAARLLVDHGDSVEHARFADLPRFLGPGDVVVVNDTRVLPARIVFERPTGGHGEILLLEELRAGWWEALARPSAKLAAGTRVRISAPTAGGSDDQSDSKAGSPDDQSHSKAGSPDDQSDSKAGGLELEFGADLGEGRRLVRLDPGARPLRELLDELGLMPLPPYITAPLADPERYQTVFAGRAGRPLSAAGRAGRPLSAAAPTAGLHFTDAVIAGLARRGVSVASLELAVGLDTFRPMTSERIDDHVMHSERYLVHQACIAAIRQAERVVAVGTTVVRALESWAATGAAEGRSDLFIRRPYRWQAVDVLVTNFHLPRSTLLCLVDAFVGERWRELYSLALAERYRFGSFGDAMLLTRRR